MQFALKAAFGCALLFAASAQAENFPSRPVRMIVPFPAGGSNDLVARVVAEKLQTKWGQSVYVENKTGGGGNIGGEAAAQAEGDGYNILVSPPSALSINGLLYKHISYRPADFVPVTLLAIQPNLIVVRRELGVETVPALVDYLKKSDGKATLGSQGNGSTPHLTGSMFMNMTGTKMTHIPYRGEGAVVNDMLGGRIDVFFGNVAAIRPFAQDTRLRILAVTDDKRTPFLPDVPTTAEAGLPGFVSTSWFAMALPPKTPAAIQKQIADAVIEIVKMPDVQAKFRAIGVDPVGDTPAQMATFVAEETTRWGEVIRKNGITAE